MGAHEFNAWCAWMDEQQVGPAWDQLRHAQLMAAIYTGPSRRQGGGSFKAADFMPRPAEAVEPQAPRTPEEIAADLARGFAALDWAGTKGLRHG